ncbi:hypothetical protein DLM20_24905, partial [Salmonella enterica subsp. enterica serovar Java]|nr:hypothetical protein [Salmonella enterica subsp. enterica serovar Java]
LEQGVDFRVCVEVPVIVEMAELVPAIDFDALAKTDASLRAEPWWDADFGETALTFIKKVRAGSLNTYPLTDRVWRPFGLIQDHGHWFWVADCLNSSGANAHGQ